jgi:hypothetical protein
MKQQALITLTALFTITSTYSGEVPMKMHNENQTASFQQSRIITVGSHYKHYSGKLYKVIAIAHDSEDPSLMRVIYQGLYDCATFGPNPIWDRPYTMFAENVVINGVEQPRFADVIQ